MIAHMIVHIPSEIDILINLFLGGSSCLIRWVWYEINKIISWLFLRYGFIIHKSDLTVVICYLIWPCDMAVHIMYLISNRLQPV